MFFMTIGIPASPLAFGFISASPYFGAVRLVAELALALVLFIDASMIDKAVGGYIFCRLAASSGRILRSAVQNRLS